MDNNNDISLFEKVVFVDNIPSEDHARDLSIRYPFAVFVSDYGDFGTDNGEDTPLPNVRDWNQFAFNNLWKNGKRLTKFNNVNPEKSSVDMNTYTIDLDFDLRKGLLSLSAVPKIKGYDVIGFISKTSKDGPNIYTTYLSTKIEDDIKANKISNVKENADTMSELSTFGQFTINNFENIIYNIDGFDSVDNKVYMIVSFNSDNNDTLRTISASSYDITCLNDEFRIVGTPMFAGDKLNRIIDYEDPQEKESEISLIMKYTENLVYKDYYQRCLIYELEIVKNVEPENIEDTSLLSFSFNSLKNMQNIDIEYAYAYVNPLSFELKAFIDNNWETIELSNQKDTYSMPGISTLYSLKMYPENLRRLRLDTTLTKQSGFTNGFVFQESNTASTTYYNWGSNTSNEIRFTVHTPDDFEVSPTNSDKSRKAYLNIAVKNYKDTPDSNPGTNTVLRYRCDQIKLTQYLFRRLRLENPWNPIGLSVSGQQVNYALPNPYAIFANIDNSVIRERKVEDTDTGLTALLIVHQSGTGTTHGGSNNPNIEISTVTAPLIMEVAANSAISAYSSYVSTNNIKTNQEKNILIPWIKDSNETFDPITGKRTTEDYIYGFYGYHGYEVKDHYKYIKPDDLINISIGEGTSAFIKWTKSLYNGDEDLFIQKTNNQLLFKFRNGQTVDGYTWYMIGNMQELKKYIKVYSLYDNHRDDESMFDPTVSGTDKFKINSVKDTDYERMFYAYILFDGLKSEEIETKVKKLPVDWWIYIGQYTLDGNGKAVPSVAFGNQSHEGFVVNMNDPRSQTTNSNPYLRKVVHYGGWIHLGEVDLANTKFQRYNPNKDPMGYDYPSMNNVIWEGFETITIDTKSTVSNKKYLIILPKELTIMDAINDISQEGYQGTYTFSNNVGTYNGWVKEDVLDYDKTGAECTSGFVYWIVHRNMLLP